MSGNGNEIVLEIVKAWPNLNGYQRQALVGATQGPVISDAQGRGKDLMIVVSNLVKPNQTLEEKRELASLLLLETVNKSSNKTKNAKGNGEIGKKVTPFETKTEEVKTGITKTDTETKEAVTVTSETAVTEDKSKQTTGLSKKQDVTAFETTDRLMYFDIAFQPCYYTGCGLIRTKVLRVTSTTRDTFKGLKEKFLLAWREHTHHGYHYPRSNWSIYRIDFHKDDEHTHGHQIRNPRPDDLVTSFNLTSCTKPLVVIFE